MGTHDLAEEELVSPEDWSFPALLVAADALMETAVRAGPGKPLSTPAASFQEFLAPTATVCTGSLGKRLWGRRVIGIRVPVLVLGIGIVPIPVPPVLGIHLRLMHEDEVDAAVTHPSFPDLVLLPESTRDCVFRGTAGSTEEIPTETAVVSLRGRPVESNVAFLTLG